MPRLLAALIVVLVVGATWVVHFERTHRPVPLRPLVAGQVVRVSDGDTIVVVGAAPDGGPGPVRLSGIDAPETHDNDHALKGCYGETAKAFVANMLPPGTTVTLTVEKPERDRYQRLLAFVDADGWDVGEELLKRGYAKTYLLRKKSAYYGRYMQAETEATVNGLGIKGPHRPEGCPR